MPESRKGRGDLWWTMTGFRLHAEENCCSGAQHKRWQVRDASNPAFFDTSDFELCPRAKALCTQSSGEGEGE